MNRRAPDAFPSPPTPDTNRHAPGRAAAASTGMQLRRALRSGAAISAPLPAWSPPARRPAPRRRSGYAVADLDLVEHRRIGGTEHHGHRRHLQRGDRSVRDGDPARPRGRSSGPCPRRNSAAAGVATQPCRGAEWPPCASALTGAANRTARRTRNRRRNGRFLHVASLSMSGRAGLPGTRRQYRSRSRHQPDAPITFP